MWREKAIFHLQSVLWWAACFCIRGGVGSLLGEDGASTGHTSFQFRPLECREDKIRQLVGACTPHSDTRQMESYIGQEARCKLRFFSYRSIWNQTFTAKETVWGGSLPGFVCISKRLVPTCFGFASWWSGVCSESKRLMSVKTCAPCVSG